MASIRIWVGLLRDRHCDDDGNPCSTDEEQVVEPAAEEHVAAAAAEEPVLDFGPQEWWPAVAHVARGGTVRMISQTFENFARGELHVD